MLLWEDRYRSITVEESDTDMKQDKSATITGKMCIMITRA